MRKRSAAATAVCTLLVSLLCTPAVQAATRSGLNFTTTATVFETQAPAKITGFQFREPNQFDEICARFNLEIIGSFQYWTGSSFVSMTQSPVPQVVENCQYAGAFRQDVVAFYLNPASGTFDLTRFTGQAAPVYYQGSDGSVYLGGGPLRPLTLTAETRRQQQAIRSVWTNAGHLSDTRLVTELNRLLSMFCTR